MEAEHERLRGSFAVWRVYLGERESDQSGMPYEDTDSLEDCVFLKKSSGGFVEPGAIIYDGGLIRGCGFSQGLKGNLQNWRHKRGL